MPLRRKLVLLAAPFVGGAALGTILAFSAPALAASPSPSPSSSSPAGTNPSPGAPSTTAPAHQGNCPNM